MQRKPGFPVANCNIKMPDCPANMEYMTFDEDNEQQQRRQQLINFGHAQWGFNNWNWSVTKQELDFVDFANGKYCAGVVSFVSITVKSLDIHRENIGYATSFATSKGMAVYKSRKCAVTNALRETLLSFGGSVAVELAELVDGGRGEVDPAPAPAPEHTPAVVCRHPETRNSPVNTRKDVVDSGCANTRSLVAPPIAKTHPMPAVAHHPAAAPHPAVALHPVATPNPATVPYPAVALHPVATPHPTAAPLPAAPRPAPALRVPLLRPNSNEAPKTGMEEMNEEEARAERKRRQRLAQEEFRLKLNLKQGTGHDEHQEPSKGSGIDEMLMDIPTQDIVIEDTASTTEETRKRKSPAVDNPPKRRGSVLSKLDIVQD